MITVYGNHCPKCVILEKKLLAAGAQYQVCDDIEVLKAKGFDYVPVMEVDGQLMDFGTAVKWINERS